MTMLILAYMHKYKIQTVQDTFHLTKSTKKMNAVLFLHSEETNQLFSSNNRTAEGYYNVFHKINYNLFTFFI